MTKLTTEWLDSRNINYVVSADGLITVGGSLYLRGTQITALPDGLTVVGYLDLRGTQITALPDGLTVGGSLYLDGTQITALPDGLTVEDDVWFDGEIGDLKLAVFDGIGSIILSEKESDGVRIFRCQKSSFKDGECVGEKFFVASDGENNAHGDTLREAIEELAFKTGDRDVSQWENMPLDTVKTPGEWAFVYRMVTGACCPGTRMFMAQRDLKSSYTLSEILDETRGAYGAERFREVVGGTDA